MHLPPALSEFTVHQVAADLEVVGVDHCPQTFGPSKVGDARFRRDAGAGENQDLGSPTEHGDRLIYRMGHRVTLRRFRLRTCWSAGRRTGTEGGPPRRR